MSDYIKRRDAYMYIHAQYPQLLDAGVQLVINAIPAADVVKRKSGEWLTTDAFPHRVYCSCCYKTYIPNDRWQIWVDGDLPRNYCPNCGADMRNGGNKA